MTHTIDQVHLENMAVMVRVDLNVPMHSGKIIDYTKLYKIRDTVNLLLRNGCVVVLVSHFGRPNGVDSKFDMTFLKQELRQILNEDVCFLNSLDDTFHDKPYKVFLRQNVRFHEGELSNDVNFAKQLASGCDAYINEAFSCSHRKHASIDAITTILPSYFGLEYAKELRYLNKIVDGNFSNKIAIIAGLKVSTKFKVLTKLCKIFDSIIVAGAMANTFLAAIGCNMRNSYVEESFLPEVKEFYNANKDKIILPEDLCCRDDEGKANIRELQKLERGDNALDVGPKTVEKIIEVIDQDNTLLIWNGPLGFYEEDEFNKSTLSLANKISHCTGVTSVVGGGDTLAALQSVISDNPHAFDYVSTSGGAFLEFIEKS